jgi:hypothetical protein
LIKRGQHFRRKLQLFVLFSPFVLEDGDLHWNLDLLDDFDGDFLDDLNGHTNFPEDGHKVGHDEWLGHDERLGHVIGNGGGNHNGHVGLDISSHDGVDTTATETTTKTSTEAYTTKTTTDTATEANTADTATEADTAMTVPVSGDRGDDDGEYDAGDLKKSKS